VTLSEYLDPARFPLTARPGLSARDQFRLDAAHLARLRAYLADGVTPTEEQWLRLAELEEKERSRQGLIGEAQADPLPGADRPA
jgi:hypothetical protein